MNITKNGRRYNVLVHDDEDDDDDFVVFLAANIFKFIRVITCPNVIKGKNIVNKHGTHAYLQSVHVYSQSEQQNSSNPNRQCPIGIFPSCC